MGKCNFLLGLGIGSVLGIICYRYSKTEKAKALKSKMCEAAKNMGRHASEMVDAAKDKFANATEKA